MGGDNIAKTAVGLTSAARANQIPRGDFPPIKEPPTVTEGSARSTRATPSPRGAHRAQVEDIPRPRRSVTPLTRSDSANGGTLTAKAGASSMSVGGGVPAASPALRGLRSLGTPPQCRPWNPWQSYFAKAFHRILSAVLRYLARVPSN
jgi:hypothetical protein